MPKPRILHDEYFKLAKEKGYVARSAFKLLEIQEKKRLIRRTDRVLDLGCAPGSWLQVLDEKLAQKTIIAGIDLSRVTAHLSDRVRTMQGDIYTTPPAVLLALGGLSEQQIASGARFDVVISDMAPNTSGHGDDFLSARLCDRMLDLLPGLLRPGGNVLMKVLEGEPTPDVIARTKSFFVEAGTTKPKASRDVSREIFIWGTGYNVPGSKPMQGKPAASPKTAEKKPVLSKPAPSKLVPSKRVPSTPAPSKSSRATKPSAKR